MTALLLFIVFKKSQVGHGHLFKVGTPAQSLLTGTNSGFVIDM